VFSWGRNVVQLAIQGGRRLHHAGPSLTVDFYQIRADMIIIMPFGVPVTQGFPDQAGVLPVALVLTPED
jgi:hypothetical protein